MIIRYLKKIVVVVIADLLGLCSLMLIGCSQIGANRMGYFIEVKCKRFERFMASDTNTNKIFSKKTVKKETVKTTRTNVMVNYRIGKDDQLHLDRLFKPMSGSGFDAAKWERERTDRENHQRYFDVFAKIIPKEYRKGIQYFHIFDPGDSSTTARILAKNSDSLKVFYLGIASNLFDEFSYINQILDYPLIVCTMLHEFGHYLTVNHKQAYSLMGRRIPKKKSIFGKFENKYDSCKSNYVKRNLEDFIKNNDIDSCLIMEKLLIQRERDLYNKKECVTEYAASSILEDLAETFVYFILLDECPKAGVSILGDKVRLFYEHPEFVEIRKAIRANLKKLGIHPNMSREELRQLGIYPSISSTN